MREILFRGQRFDDVWVYGYLFAKPILESYFIIDGENQWMVKPETVGQYTGLTDVNGQKIFENDIVDASDEWWDAAGYAGHNTPILKVKWNEYECGFSPFSTYDSDCGVSIDANNCKVVGNIYDNPEIDYEDKKFEE